MYLYNADIYFTFCRPSMHLKCSLALFNRTALSRHDYLEGKPHILPKSLKWLWQHSIKTRFRKMENEDID